MEPQHLHHWGDPRLRALLLEAIVRTGRYEIALSLIDAWRSFDTPGHLDAAKRLARELYGLCWRLPEPIQSKLESSLDQLEPGGTWRDEPRRIALSLLARGAFEDSLAAFQRLLRTCGNDEIVLVGVAKAAFGAGQYAAAADAYEKLLRQRPAHGKIPLDLARCYLMTGRYRDALAIYEGANDPKHSGEIQTARIALGLVIAMVGDKQERQPSTADQIARELRDDDSDEQIFERFVQAVRVDAVSPNTWRLYSILVFRHSPIATLGSLAITVIAFFAKDDLDWFIIAVLEAFRDHARPAFPIAIEYALERFQGSFMSSFADFLSRQGIDAETYRELIEAMWDLKQGGLALRWDMKEGSAENDNLPMLCIQGSTTVPEPNKTAAPSDGD
jgi:tetratricopeptide (TPR) repeat protein